MNPMLKDLVDQVGPGEELGILYPSPATGSVEGVVLRSADEAPEPRARFRIVGIVHLGGMVELYGTTHADSGALVMVR